jgi:hypothetical protein
MYFIVGIIDTLFDDKRMGISFLMLWLILVLTLFYGIGLFSGQYMSVGPSQKTVFMHIVLDTWYKWGLVAFFTGVNTCINDFMSDAISPWLLNTVTDHKTKYLPYPKYQCLMISQLWTLYCGLMGVVGVMILLSQVDFVIIRLICDLMVSFYTNYKFMKDKIFDPHSYHEVELRHHEACKSMPTAQTAIQKDTEMNLQSVSPCDTVTHCIVDEDEELLQSTRQ